MFTSVIFPPTNLNDRLLLLLALSSETCINVNNVLWSNVVNWIFPIVLDKPAHLSYFILYLFCIVIFIVNRDNQNLLWKFVIYCSWIDDRVRLRPTQWRCGTKNCRQTMYVCGLGYFCHFYFIWFGFLFRFLSTELNCGNMTGFTGVTYSLYLYKLIV